MNRATRRFAMRRPRRRGAALLVAMIILTLVATIAGGMVWQQWRAIQVEAAERARTQSAWILTGALDWARLILREDLKPGSVPVDHLGEPWAVPLAEARLSSFLAADRDNAADDGGLDAFLSGEITDASAKFNLNNLMPTSEGKPNPVQVEAFRKLCEYVNVAGSTCDRIVEGIVAASLHGADAPLMPQRVDQLAWLGVDAADVKRLEPYVILLGVPATTINLNTAGKEVIAAVTGASLSSAGRLVQSRQQDPLPNMDNAPNLLDLPDPSQSPLRAQLGSVAAVKSNFFEVQGQVRLGDRVLRERSLVNRNDNNREVTVIRRERVNLLSPGA
jgi:general secretion pathway protein K